MTDVQHVWWHRQNYETSKAAKEARAHSNASPSATSIGDKQNGPASASDASRVVIAKRKADTVGGSVEPNDVPEKNRGGSEAPIVKRRRIAPQMISSVAQLPDTGALMP